jgi:hypothetical protein
MNMTPLLDISLGLFLAIFGLILERLGRSQFKESSQGADVKLGLQLGAFVVMTVIAAGAALLSGWVYLVGRDSRFLLQTVIALVIFVGGVLQMRRLRSQSMKFSLRLLNDSLLWMAGILMSIGGVLSLLTYPFVANNPESGLLTVHTMGQVAGVAAGFSTIVFMLVNLFVAEP